MWHQSNNWQELIFVERQNVLNNPSENIRILTNFDFNIFSLITFFNFYCY